MAETPSKERIKGAAFREFVGWYRREVDPGRLGEVIAALPPEQRAKLDPDSPHCGLLTSSWYPTQLVHGLLDGLTDGLVPEDRRRLAEDGARAVMNATLRGIYKYLFAAFASPSLYARFAPRLWHAYYESGTFTVTLLADNTAECVVADWASHHPFACDLNREAATAIYETMGLEGVGTTRTCCVSRGAADCRFLTRWR